MKNKGLKKEKRNKSSGCWKKSSNNDFQLDDSDFVMPNENNDEVPKEALIIAQTSCIESSHQRNKDKHENIN